MTFTKPNMADEWAANEVNEAVDVAPAFELESDLPEVKLFGKWNRQEVNVADISLVSYITVKEQESPNSYAIKKKDELERVAKFNGYAVLDEDGHGSFMNWRKRGVFFRSSVASVVCH
ncbi:hypothetical protein PRIPAC_97566 [Pristionchus pacificus]|uniref:Uncharacterized protein n=1 Tax=Pristionchus pacificus TaxID=54126 RepID=A0A2A6CGU5_PRIPA|nr:hypothetical protein PRIPAC_97566 [Pristionchus pacificus]|eukprot:PDM77432.1 hypothetical protein PRIPAC_33162 [Pristionchus pacificus]